MTTSASMQADMDVHIAFVDCKNKSRTEKSNT